jgi:hypothetical protein
VTRRTSNGTQVTGAGKTGRSQTEPTQSAQAPASDPPTAAQAARLGASALQVELPEVPDGLCRPAAGHLGWGGTVLPPMVLIGRRVVVVAELDGPAHAYRTMAGWRPVTDRTAVAMWSWPEMSGRVPPPAVRLRGVIAPARHWRTALTAAAAFTKMTRTALLLPDASAADPGCLAAAAQRGIAVLASDGDSVRTVADGAPGPLPAPHSPVSRWVHEFVYDRVLAELG